MMYQIVPFGFSRSWARAPECGGPHAGHGVEGAGEVVAIGISGRLCDLIHRCVSEAQQTAGLADPDTPQVGHGSFAGFALEPTQKGTARHGGMGRHFVQRGRCANSVFHPRMNPPQLFRAGRREGRLHFPELLQQRSGTGVEKPVGMGIFICEFIQRVPERLLGCDQFSRPHGRRVARKWIGKVNPEMTGGFLAFAIEEGVLGNDHHMRWTERNPFSRDAHRSALVGIVVSPPERTAHAMVNPVPVHHLGTAFMNPNSRNLDTAQQNSGTGMGIKIRAILSRCLQCSAGHDRRIGDNEGQRQTAA